MDEDFIIRWVSITGLLLMAVIFFLYPETANRG